LDGGYVNIGYSKDSPTAIWSIFLIKYDSLGNVEWDKKYNGTSKDLIHDIKETADGGFIIAGRTWSYLTMGGDSHIMKIDNQGGIIFYKVFDGKTSNWYNAAHSACELDNGDFITVGQYHMFYNPTRYDWEINHFDANGNLTISYNIGIQSGNDFALDVIADDNTTYTVTGFTENISSGKDFALYHADQYGNQLAFVNYIEIGDQEAKKVVKNSDGSYYIIGDGVNNTAGLKDFKVIKLDTNFNPLWSNSYGTISSETCLDACSDGNDGLIVVGETDYYTNLNKENLVVKINPNGNITKAISFGGANDQLAYSVTKDINNNFIILSQSQDLFNNSNEDVMIIKVGHNLESDCQFNEPTLTKTAYNLTTVPGATKSINNNPYENFFTMPNQSLIYNETFFSLEINAGEDTTLCDNQSLVLNAISNNAMATISWDNNIVNNTSFFPANSTQDYIATAEMYQCSVSDTITVNIDYPLDISIELSDTILCLTDTLNIINTTDTSLNSYTNCIWEITNILYVNNCEDLSIFFQDTGTYDLQLTLESTLGCTYDTIFDSIIHIIPPPIASFSYSPLHPQFNDLEFQFNNTSSHANYYEWTFNNTILSQETNPSFLNDVPLNFSAQLIAFNNFGCSDTTQSEIEYYFSNFYIPNTFTPNNDGLNDLFGPIGIYDYTKYAMRIYNRWGQNIFESYDPNVFWDGQLKGFACPEGVYVWSISYLKNNTTEVRKRGHVLLKR